MYEVSLFEGAEDSGRNARIVLATRRGFKKAVKADGMHGKLVGQNDVIGHLSFRSCSAACHLRGAPAQG